MIYIKDVTLNLYDTKNLNECSYEWLRVLKYKYDKNLAIKATDFHSKSNKTLKTINTFDNFHVVQMTSRILYDFEYNGNLILFFHR